MDGVENNLKVKNAINDDKEAAADAYDKAAARLEKSLNCTAAGGDTCAVQGGFGGSSWDNGNSSGNSK